MEERGRNMDKQTFSEEVRRMERSLYRVAMSYTGNVSDAADAVQEALLRAWRRRDTLRDERYFDTWLMRVVINESKTLLRRRRRMPVSYTHLEPSAACTWGRCFAKARQGAFFWASSARRWTWRTPRV